VGSAMRKRTRWQEPTVHPDAEADVVGGV
jgi:hypothetical protein